MNSKIYTTEINRLLENISSSANRLVSKKFPNAQQSNTENQKGFSLVDIATPSASYLEAKASFNVQEYVSANPYKDTGAEKYKRNIYGNSQQNQATAETTSAEGTNFAAFMPEITPQNKNMVYNQASNIYNAPLKAEQQNITQTAQDFSYSRLDYALNAYNYVKEVNQEPKILINLMHPNNRNFHFEA